RIAKPGEVGAFLACIVIRRAARAPHMRFGAAGKECLSDPVADPTRPADDKHRASGKIEAEIEGGGHGALHELNCRPAHSSFPLWQTARRHRSLFVLGIILTLAGTLQCSSMSLRTFLLLISSPTRSLCFDPHGRLRKDFIWMRRRFVSERE